MVDFNDLVDSAADLSHELLGAVTGTYYGDRRAPVSDVTAVIDRDVILPADTGTGYRRVIRGSFRLSQIVRVALGDQFETPDEVFKVASLDGDDGIEAHAFLVVI